MNELHLLPQHERELFFRTVIDTKVQNISLKIQKLVQKTLTKLFQTLLLKASLRQLAELTKSEYFLTWTKSLSQEIPKFLWATVTEEN